MNPYLLGYGGQQGGGLSGLMGQTDVAPFVNANTNPFMTINPYTGLSEYNWGGSQAPQMQQTQIPFRAGSYGGDSGNNATDPAANADRAGFNSPQAQDRAMASLGRSAKNFGLNTAMNSIANSAITGDVGLALSPSSVVGFGLSAPVNAAYSALGINHNNGFLGKAISKAPGMIAGLMGVNPAIGLALGLAAPALADATMDFAGWRDYDVARDQLEDTVGEIAGRMSYRDEMENVDKTSKSTGWSTDKEALDRTASFAKAAQEINDRLSASPNMSPDQVATLAAQANAYSNLAAKQGGGTYGGGGGYNSEHAGGGAFGHDPSADHKGLNSNSYGGGGGGGGDQTGGIGGGNQGGNNQSGGKDSSRY